MNDTSTDRPLIVYGAGGHGLVVAEAATMSGWRVLGFVDSGKKPGVVVGQWPVLDACATNAADGVPYIVAVGDNATRAQLIDAVLKMGRTLATVVHPAAIVSPSAELADGVFIGPRAIVHSQATVEQGAIVNSGAIVEHDNRIGRCAHIGPGATLCGRVTVSELGFVGANATVVPFVTIAARATVGAGAVVLSDVEAGATVVGNPAKVMG